MFRVFAPFRWAEWAARTPIQWRSEPTVQRELLLESGDAILLESSPDAAGQPEFIVLETATL